MERNFLKPYKSHTAVHETFDPKELYEGLQQGVYYVEPKIDGRDITEFPLAERRSYKLSLLRSFQSLIVYTIPYICHQSEYGIENLFAAIKVMTTDEGVVVKKNDSQYNREGSKFWAKLKW